MIYVTSDLHGCSPADLEALLRRANFNDEDFLFILGDVIDRGEHGADLLIWLTQQPNVSMILGNHEALLLACNFLFQEVTEESLSTLDADKLRLLEVWLENGGGPTLTGLRSLLKQDPELLYGILDELRDAPLYETVTAGERRYILVHAGLGNFSPDKPLSAYTPEELLLARPAADERYFDDVTVIFGHTPTECFDPGSRGRAFHGPGWICIDGGCAAGNPPLLLRLDDEKEFH